MATFETNKLMEIASRIREMREIFGFTIKEMAEFFTVLDKIADEGGLTITISVSAAEEELPDFVKKYI